MNSGACTVRLLLRKGFTQTKQKGGEARSKTEDGAGRPERAARFAPIEIYTQVPGGFMYIYDEEGSSFVEP